MKFCLQVRSRYITGKPDYFLRASFMLKFYSCASTQGSWKPAQGACILHKQSANQATSQICFFFLHRIFFSIPWQRNHHFWLLIVLMHVLRIVGKWKCQCSGLQHSQLGLSYERNASSEWTLAKGCSYNLKMNHSSLLYPRTTTLPLIMCTTCIIFQPHS